MWTKSYDVTIQMKALSLNSHLVLFVFQNVTKCNLEIWSKFLAIFGSERVKKGKNKRLSDSLFVNLLCLTAWRRKHTAHFCWMGLGVLKVKDGASVHMSEHAFSLALKLVLCQSWSAVLSCIGFILSKTLLDLFL